MNKKIIIDVYRELLAYKENGISIYLNGEYSSPEEIVEEYMICEKNNNYMREYQLNEKGDIVSLEFSKL